jgi:hypothetical protein
MEYPNLAKAARQMSDQLCPQIGSMQGLEVSHEVSSFLLVIFLCE